MNIIYNQTKDLEIEQLQDLFLSVKFDSGNYPEMLKQAIANSHRVVTAWDTNKLVGLVNALSDGVMTAYFHYFLIRPEYQRKGIGCTLMKMMLDEYAGYARKIVISYDHAVKFYEQCGFAKSTDTAAMFITWLKT